MELWGILDVNGNKTDRTIVRGQPLKEGEYHLVVHVFIVNNKNEFLIQKRSMEKELWPGRWDITCGSIVSGEDSLTGAIREVEEELGITIMPEKFSLLTRLQRDNNLVDVWVALADFSLDDVIMQEDEVDAVKFVNAEDMLSIVFDDEYDAEYRDDGYREVMINYIKTLCR